MSKVEELIFNMGTIVDNIIPNNWNLLRAECECSHQEKQKGKYVKWWMC